MDKTFQKLLRAGIDLSAVGVESRPDNGPYFCTPKGASVFGWAGVDGIHFCFIRGFGGTVFAVSPENACPNYVHPLALNFADFLRLLLACGDAAALEQAWLWDETQFETFLRDNPPTSVQRETLALIADNLKLTPMKQPFEYIKGLQASFDYGKIKYTEEYYEVVKTEKKPTGPVWKVFFDGGFCGHCGKDRSGTEIRLDKKFEWAGHNWTVPAAYSCGKGLVVDFCMRIPAEDIRKFMKKWDLSPENDSCENFTQEQQLQIDSESPLSLDIIPYLELNGRTMRIVHGCSVVFNPCLPDMMIDEDTKWVTDHYDLDVSYGWMIFRAAFPWATKKRPLIKSLSLTMALQPRRVAGPHFKVHAPGDRFSFVHPVSGTAYTLTVRDIEHQTISQCNFGSNRYFYPTHFIVLSYTLFPETEEDISVCDCCEGDKPLRFLSNDEPFASDVQDGDTRTGIIGGADGPTVIMIGKKEQAGFYTACSSLHFEPNFNDAEWRIVFGIKSFDEMTVDLI